MPKKFGFAFWQSQRDRLKELYYDQGLSTNEIGKIYGCYGETIGANMNKLGFKLRKIGDSSRPNALHNVNTSFFENINNELTAYVLGYTLTDGHVTNDGKIMYCAKDKDIIDKVHKAIDSTHPITTKIISDNKYYSFCVSSKYMCKTLWNLGFDNHKSLNMKMDEIEKIINKENIRHLLRGMIDGDGYLQCTINLSGRNKKHTLAISFTNNADVCSFVDKYLNFNTKWTDEENGFYTIRTANREKVIQIGHYLYDDATIYIDRKKNKFDEICQTYLKEK